MSGGEVILIRIKRDEFGQQAIRRHYVTQSLIMHLPWVETHGYASVFATRKEGTRDRGRLP